MKGKKINTHLSIIPDLTRLHVAPSFIHIISDKEKKKIRNSGALLQTSNKGLFQNYSLIQLNNYCHAEKGVKYL